MTFVRQDSGKVIFSLLEPKPREGTETDNPAQVIHAHKLAART